jgi:acetyl esterase/lipase
MTWLKFLNEVSRQGGANKPQLICDGNIELTIGDYLGKVIDKNIFEGCISTMITDTTSKEFTEKYSNEKQIDANTPKTFIVHSTDDKVVPVENSINYYMNLKKYNVPVEMHLYENGGHGFGLGTKGTHTEWPKACEKWLTENALLN